MTYVDDQYIKVARKNEMQHHEHTLEKLQAQIAQLTKTVEWELHQHHSRLKELQQVEGALALKNSHMAEMPSQPSIESGPSTPRRTKTKTRKSTRKATQELIPELVG